MTSEGLAGVTDADIRSLAAKLRGLHALLAPGEQALLHVVLRRAANRDEPPPDVVGFAWTVSFNPFIYLDAITAGVSSEGGASGG